MKDANDRCLRYRAFVEAGATIGDAEQAGRSWQMGPRQPVGTLQL
jgi:hypothetical protein